MKSTGLVALAALLVACSGADSQTLSSRQRDAESEVDAAVGAGDAASEDGEMPIVEQDGALAEACPNDEATPVVEHSGNVSQDETWAAGRHVIVFQTSVRADATLTIAPCAVVQVRSGQGIDVRDGASLVAEGAPGRPIRFEAASDTWTTFQVYPGADVKLAYASISGAGTSNDSSAAALSIRGALGAPVIRVQHVTIEGAPRFGVRLDQGGQFSADSTDLTVHGAAEFPIITHPNSAGSVPSGTYTGNGQDEILITDGSILTDMTLSARGVPYRVGRPGSRNTSLRVAANPGTLPEAPLLTIEAGVTLRFEPASIMEVEHFTNPFAARGALRVLGSAERPVLFTSAAAVPAPGDWLGIWFGGLPDPRNLIDHARIEYAGGVGGAQSFSCENPAAPAGQQARNQAAVLIMGLPPSSFVTNTSIAHSAGDGIERGYFGEPLDFLASNSFENVAWCQQSYPRPVQGACPSPVPCPR